MLKVMLQKLWHKIWMVLCLLLGSSLLIATVVSFPLYQNAVFDRMIRDEFDNALADTGKWPFRFWMTTKIQGRSNASGAAKIESNMEVMAQELGLPVREKICVYISEQTRVSSLLLERTDLRFTSLRMGMMSQLPEHTEILTGSMYSESGADEDGVYEAVVFMNTLIKKNLLIGETLELQRVWDKEGKNIRVKVVGVCAAKDAGDFYWQKDTEELEDVLFINEQRFRKDFLGEGAGDNVLTGDYYELFDYKSVTARNVRHVLERTIYYREEGPIHGTVATPAQREIIENYLVKQRRISDTLFVLQVPVLVLLGVFLFMISGQMYDLEKNEISVMKSRGASSAQIFRLYFYQSVFLTGLGTAGGIPLGAVFCRILGSTGNFLEFDFRRNLPIKYESNVWRYAAAAALVSVLIMTIPALRHSRLSIVHLKQKNVLKKRSWWEKIFLDVILLGVSLYGYYSFSRTQEDLAAAFVARESLDPLLYLSSSLFILGMGLLFLRLWPIVIRLIFLCGRRFWGPANYASFMEIIKNGRKQQFIMLFMILTISLGMYHAVIARTILQNAKENAQYMESADIMLMEVWHKKPDEEGKPAPRVPLYFQQDYGKYASMPDVQTYTKVYTDGSCRIVSQEVKTPISCQLMAIHTKEYGLITNLPKGLLEEPYRKYLNALAAKPNGVLLSAHFRDVLGFQVGHKVTITDRYESTLEGEVVGFFEYWPGYEPESIELLENGEAVTKIGLKAIVNFAAAEANFMPVLNLPYEVWAKLAPGKDMSAVYQWLEDNDIHLQKFKDRSLEMKKVVEDPLLQGTNGVLTMGFIVTIILCGVGYLIYWIMSIRSREMMFGVLRACGMHKGELFRMLMNEQLFSGALSIFAGIEIGHLASRMFTPLIQTAYAAEKQILPMKLIVDQGDLIRLYTVIAGVMALCLIVLLVLVVRLNITKALKLGEE